MTQERRAFSLAATILTFVVGCVDSSSAPSPQPPFAGTWDFVGDRVPNFAPATACKDTGTFTVTKTDSTWVGTFQRVSTCRNGVSAYSFSETSTIRSGLVVGDRLTFVRATSIANCADSATIDPVRDGTIVGTERCDDASATWRAERSQPIATVAFASPTLLSVPGDIRTLDVAVRTSSGQRVFGRSVTWSSDNANVATISLGNFTAVGAGAATISATVEGKTASLAVTVLPPTPFTTVSAGDAFTCAIGADQHTYCWGHAPGPNRLVATPVQSAPLLSSISTSQHSVCGVSATSEVWCWGQNESGQLGIGTTIDTATPARVHANGQSFKSVSAGGRHTCAIATDGHAWCWGANDAGQLGNGTLVGTLAPVAVAGGLTFTAVSAGDSHSCGVASTGALYCWGSNTDGQLGDSTTVGRLTPTHVSGAHVFQTVSAGFFHTCAIASGAAWCWGRNNVGQFGNGTTTSANYPVSAATGLNLTSVATSLAYSCGVTGTGEIWCWGFKGTGTWGQLGDGGRIGSSSPVKVSGSQKWASVTTGVYLYSDESTNAGTAAQTCGVTASAGAAPATWCWGDNLIGQLGTGTRTESAIPIKVSGQP